MGNYIVVGILFIFFIGVLSLLMDMLCSKPNKTYYVETKETPATVILEESFEVDVDKFYD